MSDCHSSSSYENILSADMIEKNLFNNKEHSEQLDRIIKSKGKLIAYLSIFYGVITVVGLVYLFIFNPV